MKKYKFVDGVYFIRGSSGATICDTNTTDVYWINPEGVQAILEHTHPEYWDELKSLNLVEEAESWVAFPDIPRGAKPELSFIWFEIMTSDCNESCQHCYADSMPPTKRRALGLEVEESTARKLSYVEWCKLIDEGFAMGARRCQFIGGEPMLFKDGDKGCIDLAEYAKKAGYSFVEIYTNATLLTEAKVQRIAHLGISVAVSLYSSDPDVHDAITKTHGSHAMTMRSLEWLNQYAVRTRVETVVMKPNEDTVKQTIELVDSMGFGHKSPDPIRPKGRGDKITLFPSLETVATYGMMTSPNYRARKSTIEHYSSSHSCLAGKITITEGGDILPCIFSRTQILGNVVEAGSLEAVVMANSVQQVWNTTKDVVLVCRDCEFRYVCFDCRPLSEGVAAGQSDFLHAPYPRCTFNPYTGEWAKGLWRMMNGEPYYDRTHAERLTAVAMKGAAVEIGGHGE